MNHSIIISKKCSKCGKELPATSEYFYTNKGSRYGLQSQCKSCRQAYDKKYYAENQETIKARSLNYTRSHAQENRDRANQWRKNNPERKKEADRNNYVKNPAKYKQRAKSWRENNSERSQETQREWRKNNSKRKHETDLKWRKANVERARRNKQKYRQNNLERIREQGRKYSHNRRVQKQGNGGTYTIADIQKQLQSQKRHCYYCNKMLRKKYHIDHVIPLVHGGNNSPDNLVCTCSFCNHSKGAKTLREWVDSIPNTELAIRVAQRIVERESLLRNLFPASG